MYKFFAFCMTFGFTATFLLSVEPALGETKNGVTFTLGRWSLNNDHYEPSFKWFKTYLDNKNLRFSSGDFYSAITLAPEFNSVDGACQDEDPDIAKFFRGLFGTTETGLLVITLTASSRTGHLGAREFLTEVPLIFAGKGIDGANQKSPEGCFFDYIKGGALHAPYIRHDGSSNFDYRFDFRVRKADNLDFNIVATLKESLGAFSGMFGWTAMTAERIGQIASQADKVQTGLARAFTSNDTKPVKVDFLGAEENTWPLQRTWRLQITPRELEQAKGYLAIYARMSASIVLDNLRRKPKITPDDVLADQEVGAARCIPEFPKPTCTVSRRSFRAAFKANAEWKDTPPRFFDLVGDGMKKVFDTCDGIRSTASGDLGLSTLDALLVRWAAVRLSKLDLALKDSVKAKAIATASNVEVDDLIQKCWHADDDDKLKGVIQAMGKELG